MTASPPPDTAALQAEVDRLRLQLASLPGLLWTADASGGIDFPGPQWTDYTGLSAAELRGQGWLSVLHPDDRAAARAAWDEAVRNRAALTTEHRLRRHDDAYRWFAVRATPVAAADGTLQWYGSCTDIDDLKGSQRALQEAERRYSALFNNRLYGIAHLRVVTDADGRPLDLVYERVNDAWERIIGIPRREVEGRRLTAVFPGAEDLEPDLVEALGGIALGGGEKMLEIDFPPTQQWFSTYVYSHSRGRCTLLFTDITAQKKAEAELRQRQTELEGFFRQAATGLAVVDTQGHILRINQRFCDIVGYTEDELIGLGFAAITHPDDLHDNLVLFQRLLAGEIHEYSYEKRYRRKQGGWVWVALSVALVRNEDTGKSFIISVIQDIDTRKRLETELRRAHQELEARVAQRTAELEEAREHAEAARKLAESANRAKSEFLATMSHEIRTPLNGVIGFNGLLLDGPLTEDKRRYAELARQSGESLLHLLNDFLDFSKIEAGRLELEPVAFDLAQEVGHVLTLVSAEAHGKGLAVHHSVNAPTQLLGDAARLRQILLNLLGNAVKFTESGSVDLCCEEVLRTEAQTWICCQVADTGIGIDPSARDRLFQPFVQADASTTRRYGGTGLGLAISKQLAIAMGGKIGFRSTPGEGSTFWVELPFTLLAQAPVFVAEPQLPPPLADGEKRGRVLVVEDNPVSQLLAAEIFRRLGCQVDVVGNGKEGVEAFRRLPYDIIFMDCDMPVMNGYDATCAIRALAQPGEHIPIIAMTASVLQGDMERCIAVGMDDFMSKPLRLQLIAAMVDKWLRPAPLQPVPAPAPPPAIPPPPLTPLPDKRSGGRAARHRPGR